MAISVKYSVKAQDLEEARSWVEKTTGLEAEPRESSYWGGDYYLFETSDGEELKLINNVDIYDDEPVIGDLPDWKIALLFNGPEAASSVLQLLGKNADRFEKVSETEY
ncbi:hypothetical protein [Hyphomicrobium sp.]|uniref:hypothetical protein n=1 Tax=Hyphomicrobium sp. TaxID=82 RepID=UPI003F6F8EB0